jgi:tRNA G10  N-methylase Trm11
MKKYIFVLGRDRNLSYLELLSYFQSRNINYSLVYDKENISIFSLPEIDFKKMINKLGGTIKIGEVISEGEDLISNLDRFNIDIDGNKINYSLSLYNNSQIGKKINEYFKLRFRDEKIKFVTKIFINQDSPRKLNKKTTPSLDIMVCSNYIAKTIAISNPIEYKEFDKRPENDFLKSTSVRLAKILLNLSQAKEGQTILDPFCGIGAILQQAILMDFNVIGIDFDNNSVDQTNKNLTWTKAKFKTKNFFKITFGDSRRISSLVHKGSFSAVVTEPYLGPYIKNTLSKDQAIRLISELEDLYSRFFKELNKIIQKDSFIVIIMPKFRTKEKQIIKVNMDKILGNSFRFYSPYEKIEIPLEFFGINKKIIREIYILRAN